MKIAITGGTGFIGRYILRQLARAGHSLRCWCRPTSDRSGLEVVAESLEWLQGDLNDATSSKAHVVGRDAVVHAALNRPGHVLAGEAAHLTGTMFGKSEFGWATSNRSVKELTCNQATIAPVRYLSI